MPFFDYDPEEYVRQARERRRQGILRRSWDMFRGVMGTIANVPGAATGVIAGTLDPESYWKAYEQGVASTGKTEAELSLPEILRVAPGVGEVATAEWEPEGPIGGAAKNVAMLAGNIATDPLSFAAGGIPTAAKALSAYRLGKLGLIGSRAAPGAIPHVVGGVLASPIPAALSYGPELVGAVGQGLRQTYEGLREGDLEKIVAGGVQTIPTAALGALMGKGIANEFRPGKIAMPAAVEAAAPRTPRGMLVGGSEFEPAQSIADLARREPPLGRAASALEARADEMGAELMDEDLLRGRRAALRRKYLEAETPIDAEFRILDQELPAGEAAAPLARQERPGREIPTRPRVVVPDVEDLVSRRLEELRAREPKILPAGEEQLKAAEHGQSDVVTSEAATKATQPTPEEGGPLYAYRVRDVGEMGLPSVESHSQFSMSETDVRKMAPSRSDRPQEVIRVNLKNFRPEEYRTIDRPDQPAWVKMERPLDESEVEVVGKITKDDVDAASKAALTPGLDEAVRAIETDPEGVKSIGAITGLDEAQVRRGITQVKADKMEEFGPEAIAVKRAILASGWNRKFALDTKPPRAEIIGEKTGADLPLAARPESIREPVESDVAPAGGPRAGALGSSDRGLAGLPGREGTPGAGRGAVEDTTRAEVPVAEGVTREPIEISRGASRGEGLPEGDRALSGLTALPDARQRGRVGYQIREGATEDSRVGESPAPERAPAEAALPPVRPEADLDPRRVRAFELSVADDLKAGPYFTGPAKVRGRSLPAVRQSKAAVQYKLGDLPLIQPRGRTKQGQPYQPHPPKPDDMVDAQERVRGAERFEPSSWERYAVRPSPIGFYSRLSRVVEDARTPAKGKASDLLRFLKDPKRGVKKDELYWTGLEDYLKAKGDERITREEIAQFLSEREVKIGETRLGSPEQDAVKRADDASPKFAQWQEPGGTNYREVLLSLPDARGKAYEEIVEAAGRSWDEGKAAEKLHGISYAEAIKGLRSRPTFTGGHFDEPNIVVHLRLNDRVDAEGKRVLFIEEIQSDWGEKGRRGGFGEDRTLADRAKGLLAEKQGTTVADIEEQFAYLNPADYVDLADKTYPGWRPKGEGMIPRAPFVEDTEAWTGLAMKRALRIAAEGGYQRLAWTTGEMQAARYDLSKQLDSVTVLKSPTDDGYVVRGKKGDQNIYGSGAIPREKLADTIGKDLAEKALRRLDEMERVPGGEEYRGAEFSGLDLKVGGEGMKGFYDGIVPQVANKIGKQWGAKVSLPSLRQEKRAGESLADGRRVDKYASLSLDPMDRGMSAVSDNDQVAKAVVGALPIDVMNMLSSEGIDPKAFVRDPEMFASKFPADRKVAVTDGLRRALSETATRLRTGLHSAYQAGLDGELLPAFRASDIDADVASRIAFPEGHRVGDGSGDADIRMGEGGTPPRAEAPGGTVVLGRREGDPAERTRFEDWHGRMVAQRWGNVNGWSMTLTPQMRESIMLGQPLFAARKARPAIDATAPRFAEVRSALGEVAEKGPDNSTFYLRTPAGRVEVRWSDDGIRINPEALKAEYGEGARPEDFEAVGVFVPWEGLIQLRRGEAGLDVVGHEAWHAVKEGMRAAGQWDAAFDDMLRKQFKTEAEEANGFADWAKKRATGPRSVFERVAQWIDRMLRAFMPDWRNVFERSFKAAAEGPGERFGMAGAEAFGARSRASRNVGTYSPETLDIRYAGKPRVFPPFPDLDDEQRNILRAAWDEAQKTMHLVETDEENIGRLGVSESQTKEYKRLENFGYVDSAYEMSDPESISSVRPEMRKAYERTAGVDELFGKEAPSKLEVAKRISERAHREADQNDNTLLFYANPNELAERIVAERVSVEKDFAAEQGRLHRMRRQFVERPASASKSAKALVDTIVAASKDPSELQDALKTAEKFLRKKQLRQSTEGLRYAVKPRSVVGAAAPRPVTPPAPAAEKEVRTQASKGPEIKQGPAVEFKDEDYRRNLKEAQAVGGRPNMRPLDRDEARAWDSYDDEVNEINATVADEQLYNRQRDRKLTVPESMALASRVEAKKATIIQKRAALDTLSKNADEFTRARVVKEYVAALADSAAAERAILNDATGAGRGLQAYARIMAASTGPGDEWAQMRKILKEIPGINNERAAELVTIARQSPESLQDALHAAMKPRGLRKFLEWYKASLLSAPSSHAANISGNMLEHGTRIAETALGSQIDRILRGIHGGRRERFLMEAGAEMRGSMEAFGPALGRLMTALRRDVFTLKPEKIDIEGPSKFEHQVGALGGKFGRGVRTPFRALGAVDDFAKDVGGMSELFKLATRKAASETAMRGKGVQEIRARAAQIIREALDDETGEHLDLIRMVGQSKLDRTFQTKLEEKSGVLPGFARFIQQAAEAHPLFQIVVPFIRTPANIAQATIERSPIGWGKAIRVYRQFLDGKATRGEVADVIAKPLLGSMIIGGFMAYAAGGGMTGSGPTDPDEKNLLRETGWQPYSFVLPGLGGKIYVPFNRFEPVSSLLGFAADMVEIRDQKTAGDIFDKAVGSVIENLTSKTYLTGLSSTAALISRPKLFAGEWVRQVSRGMVPNIIGRMAQAVDPVLRDVRPQEGGIAGLPETALKTVASRIPGVSTMLPARRSATGKEIEREGIGISGLDAAARLALPVQPTLEREADVERLLVRIGYVPAQPARERTVKGLKVRVGDSDYAKMQDANAWAAREIQRRFLGKKGFEELADTLDEGGKRSKEYYVRRVYDEARERAAKVLNRSQDFRRRVLTARRERRGQANT